jgi:hypothetical protein
LVAAAAAFSHRKSPEKPMCSQVNGEVGEECVGDVLPCAQVGDGVGDIGGIQ